jgi:hypothetical protein
VMTYENLNTTRKVVNVVVDVKVEYRVEGLNTV